VTVHLAERLQAARTFTPVYSWINGTVERAIRDILQVLRVMLLELQLNTRNWLYLLPVIQANLNHSPMQSLDIMRQSNSSRGFRHHHSSTRSWCPQHQYTASSRWT
jgi:hypothetical protein